VSQKKTDVESDTQIESEQTNKLSLHSYLKQKLEQKNQKVSSHRIRGQEPSYVEAET